MATVALLVELDLGEQKSQLFDFCTCTLTVVEQFQKWYSLCYNLKVEITVILDTSMPIIKELYSLYR